MLTPTPRRRGDPILRRLPAEKPNVAEIGVLAGSLSEYLLQARQDLYLVLVDSWCSGEYHSDAYKLTGDPHSDQSQDAADRARVAAERRVAPFRRRVTMLWMDSVKAAERINDGALDLVFIDADHSYDGVRADISAWLPKLSPGGYMAGHDYDHSNTEFKFGVKRAVDEFVANNKLVLELDADQTWFARIQ